MMLTSILIYSARNLVNLRNVYKFTQETFITKI